MPAGGEGSPIPPRSPEMIKAMSARKPAGRTEVLSPNVTAYEPSISYLAARLQRASRKAISERVKPFGLTTLQYTTLTILLHRGGLSNAQLARRSFMTPQAMNEVLAALEQRGLVMRNAHPNHRRVFPATLTPEGRRVVEACDAEVEALEREMLAELTPEQVKSMRNGLMAAVRALGAGFPLRD
jgi:DNA-binding MarR family transcriptional regulator